MWVMIWSTHTSSGCVVSTVSSGATGGSYGADTPLNSGISPARAFAYRPFTSRDSQHLDRCVDEHLDETPGGVHRPDGIPVGRIRRDERGERDQAGILEQSTDLADPPDVLRAIIG